MQWVRQDAVETASKRNRSRTAWLDPLGDKIRSAIREYYVENPDGTEVTMAVFDRVAPELVEGLLDNRTLDAGRRELGLRIPIELVDAYGAHRVETWRQKDGRSAASRRTRVDWPKNYTPHRVRFDAEGAMVHRAHQFGDGFEHGALWGPIFEAWFDVLADYREAAKDLGWWHNEPANVSLLAGAIWRQKVPTGSPRPVTISEFAVSREGRSNIGRADLWFSVHGQSVDLECKVTWPRSDGEIAKVLTASHLDEAESQLRSVPEGSRSPLRFAVCFVVPAVTATGPDASAILDSAQEWALAEGAAVARFELQSDQLADAVWGGFSYQAVMMVVRRVQ